MDGALPRLPGFEGAYWEGMWIHPKKWSSKTARPYHSVRHIVLTQAEDGIIEATPLKFKPGVVQAETAAGYYPLANGCGHVPPQVGDMIEIELRG